VKVTIHQPEHFPYLGFFRKMEAADLFVVLDDVQYTKGNFQNRNRFLNRSGQEEFFTIELEPGANRKNISEVMVSKNPKWRKIILTKLQTNFRIDLSEIYNHSKLIDINMASINYCRQRLGVQTPMMFSSQLGITSHRSQRLADICQAVGATEYISGSGGRDYLDESLFRCKVSYFHAAVPDHYSTLQHLSSGD
jgi:hypothetical protein